MDGASPPEFSEAAALAVIRRVEGLGRMLVERQPTISFTYKSDGTVLSDLDLEVQRRIRDCVRGLPFRDAASAHFVGEEEDPDGRRVTRGGAGPLQLDRGCH